MMASWNQAMCWLRWIGLKTKTSYPWWWLASALAPPWRSLPGSPRAPPLPAVKALIALGLPTAAEGRNYSYRFLADCTTAKLFLSGDHDQYAPATQLAHVVDSVPAPKRLLLIGGADHFFTGQLNQM